MASATWTSTWAACWSPTRDPARSSGTFDHACSIRDLDLYLGGMLGSHEGPSRLFRYSLPCLQYQGPRPLPGRHAGVPRGTRPALQVQLTRPTVSATWTSTWVACWSHTRDPAHSSGTVDHACSGILTSTLAGMLESHKGPGPLFRYS